MVESGTYPISGVDMKFTYDTTVLSVSKFIPSSQFNSILYQDLDASAGSLRFAAVDTTANTAPMGSILLGTLTLVGKTVGMSKINVSDIQITATNLPGSIPTFVGGAEYVVALPTPIPTATPVPTNTPTLTVIPPTNVPTVPPTATPILPTATSVPPTPTPTVTYVPADINHDTAVNILDYNIWRDAFVKQYAQ